MSENNRKIVIVGGVAGGASAAARLRRLDEHAQITVFERTGYMSYANCGLPYYIGGVIEDRAELTLQTPLSFAKRFRVDVKVHHEVTAVNKEEKAVTVKDLETGQTWDEPYDTLILAPGARPFIPDIPGTDSSRVFALRTLEDTFRIKDFIDAQKPETALIWGAGFIGLELAENLAAQGISVTMVQRSGHVLGSHLDAEIASFVQAALRAKGVNLILREKVTSINEDGNGLTVELSGGALIRCTMAVIALGVVPENDLAVSAGLKTGIKGAIVVNDRMQTSAADIYAVGDAVQVKQYITGSDAVITLAGPANKQARTAADNICGIDSTYKGSLGSSVIRLFDSTVAFTGLSEKAALAQGIACSKVILSPSDHAGYYPGSSAMTMKVIFDRDSDRLLGAQIFGRGGVDKRIDVIAAAIWSGMQASSLKDLDLAYAPPYSSAKDPVNMAGFMIENVEKGIVKQFFCEDLPDLPHDGSVNLVDVRTPWEYSHGYAAGFVNIPVDELRERIGEIDPCKPTYVMCQSAIRSYIACRILTQNGYDCYNFAGGYRLYASVTKDVLAAAQAMPCGADK